MAYYRLETYSNQNTCINNCSWDVYRCCSTVVPGGRQQQANAISTEYIVAIAQYSEKERFQGVRYGGK